MVMHHHISWNIMPFHDILRILQNPAKFHGIPGIPGIEKVPTCCVAVRNAEKQEFQQKRAENERADSATRVLSRLGPASGPKRDTHRILGKSRKISRIPGNGLETLRSRV